MAAVRPDGCLSWCVTHSHTVAWCWWGCIIDIFPKKRYKNRWRYWWCEMIIRLGPETLICVQLSKSYHSHRYPHEYVGHWPQINSDVWGQEMMIGLCVRMGDIAACFINTGCFCARHDKRIHHSASFWGSYFVDFNWTDKIFLFCTLPSDWRSFRMW